MLETRIMKIKEMSDIQRPRERLVSVGAEHLSDTELLAIIINSGTAQMSSLDLAAMLLSEASGSLAAARDVVLEMSLSSRKDQSGCKARKNVDRRSIKGISTAKAVTLAAAFELGRRACSEVSLQGRTSVRSPSDIYAYMGPRLRGLEHEECWAIFLNRANYIVWEEKLSQGNVYSTTFDTRVVLKKTLEHLTARGLILVHNHPSGNPLPGEADVKCTEKLRDALETFDLKLYDHIIVSDDCYFSFDEGRVRFPSSDELLEC